MRLQSYLLKDDITNNQLPFYRYLKCYLPYVRKEVEESQLKLIEFAKMIKKQMNYHKKKTEKKHSGKQFGDKKLIIVLYVIN